MARSVIGLPAVRSIIRENLDYPVLIVHQMLKKKGYVIGRNTVGRYMRDLKKSDGIENKETQGEVEVEVDLVKMHQQRERERQHKKELVEAVRENSFRTFISDTIRENVLPMPPVSIVRPTKKSKTPNIRYPFLHFSDWHFEELVSLDATLGLNKYDIPTACRRLWRVVQVIREWKKDLEYSGRFALPELVIGLNGDFLTGTLHGLERHSDAPNVVRAALACGDLIAMAIRDLASDFDRVKVYGVVGNHGRLPDSKKVPTKDPTRSWDFVAYQIAKRRLEHMPNIEFFLPDAYGVLFEVGGFWSYMAHGNFIPNNLGVVGYGVRRFTSSLASNLQAVGKPLKYAFFGHWHSSQASEFAGVEAFIGPSLIGTQEYGFLSGGAVNRPSQELHLLDPELGHITRERLYGEGPGYPGTYQVEI